MKTKQKTARTSDPLSYYKPAWSASQRCYIFEITRNLPYLRIENGSLVYAVASPPPTAGDIVICPGGNNTIILGRFVKADGYRVLMLAGDGLEHIVVAPNPLVVTSVENP